MSASLVEQRFHGEKRADSTVTNHGTKKLIFREARRSSSARTRLNVGMKSPERTNPNPMDQ